MLHNVKIYFLNFLIWIILSYYMYCFRKNLLGKIDHDDTCDR